VLRFLTAGESHGAALVVVLDGLPAGVRVSPEELDRDLQRRQLGYGRGSRMEIERDRAEVLSGLRHGETLGSPVTVLIRNRDASNWGRVMDPWGEPPPGAQAVTCPRPGHADLAGAQKFGHVDLRNVLERASARETAARVAASSLAKAFLRQLGIGIGSHVLSIGGRGVELQAGASSGGGPPAVPLTAAGLADWQEEVDASPVRCPSAAASKRMVEAIDEARAAGHSLGGVFEVLAVGQPPGLGSHVQWDLRLDARLAAALMSIPGIKGVEFGLGFALAALPGSAAHDEIAMDVHGKGPRRLSNRAGGLEGGMTNGEPLLACCCMKPIATQARPLRTVDLATREAAPAHRERADVCAVPSAAVAGEAAVALTLADAVLTKFGGDSLEDIRCSLTCYARRLGGAWR